MREINRKGAEKEGTDMDAFVENQEEVTQSPAPPLQAPIPTSSTVPVPQVSAAPLPSAPAPSSPPVIEEPHAGNRVDNLESEEVPDEDEMMVAAKNEENSKVSAADEELKDSTLVIENIPAKPGIMLRHSYKEDQWSPLNPEGRKKYEREFLLKLQNDPQSKKKPVNLPDLEVVLRDSGNKSRVMDSRSFSLTRGSNVDFTPNYVKSTTTRPPLNKRNSQQGKPKAQKGILQISLSLKEDVKLHETENAWKPTRMKGSETTEEEIKSEELYKRVRGVLNRLTPQKFSTLVSQVQNLPIDSRDRLQGVIDLVFEKAIDEPSFSVAYAEMCKVLAMMQVPNTDGGKDGNFVNFRKLLITRCQREFEKDTASELKRENKLSEMDVADSEEKKKELRAMLEEEERKVRMKSVGNIRFIGELYKLNMLTANIMHECIRKLLHQGDEESLECLCKLLTTVGKDLEKPPGKTQGNKKNDLLPYFQQMQSIVDKRQVSSRVRFMLQDVIELKDCNWVPRRDESNPKTMEQIEKEAEKETMEQSLAVAQPRKDDRDRDRKRNRGPPAEEGWVTAGRSSSRYSYAVDSSKLKVQPPQSDNIQLGPANRFSNWGRGSVVKNAEREKKTATANQFQALSEIAHEDRIPSGRSLPASKEHTLHTKQLPPVSAATEKERALAAVKQQVGEFGRSRSQQSSRDSSVSREESKPTSQTSLLKGDPSLDVTKLEKKAILFLEEFLNDSNYVEATLCITENFHPLTISLFVRECLNAILERPSKARKHAGCLMHHLVKENVLSIPQYMDGVNQILVDAEDLRMDVPKLWQYLAEFIVPMLVDETLPFTSFRDICQPLKAMSLAKNLVLKVLELLVKEKGPAWVKESWCNAGLQWTDFLPPEEVDNFVKNTNFDFATSSSRPLSMEEINGLLQGLLSEPASFDQICDWIGANVGDRTKEPQFIRALTTLVCKNAISSVGGSTYKLNEDNLKQNCNLLQRYLDNKEPFELQGLYAVQALVNQLEHPQGVLPRILEIFWDEDIISKDTFIAWKSSTDPQEQEGKGVALTSVTSFITWLQEADEESNDES